MALFDAKGKLVYPKFQVIQDKQYYSIKEFVAIIPISKPTAYKYVTDGKIPSKRLGSKILIPRAYVELLCEKMK